MSTRLKVTLLACLVLTVGSVWLISNANLTHADGEEIISFDAQPYTVSEADGYAQLRLVQVGIGGDTAIITQTSGDPLIHRGTLDSLFTTGSGFDGPVRAMARRVDRGGAQKEGLVVGGDFTSFNGVARARIAQLHADGSLDTAFQPGDGPNDTINAIALQLADLPFWSIDKVIIGGDFTSVDQIGRNRIARLNADGTLDSTFDPGSGTNGSIRTVVVQKDLKILIGGTFTLYNGIARNRIARLNQDGTLDTTFDSGTGANGTIQTLALQPDGKIIVGGFFSAINGRNRIRVARLNSNGSLDTSFDPAAGPANTVMCLAVEPSGRILVGGSFNSVSGQPRRGIAELNSDGSLNPGFDPGNGADNPAHNAIVYSLAVQYDGQILLAGEFVSYNNTTRNRIARLNPDGSVDANFNPGSGADNAVRAMLLQPDGMIEIGGDFLNYQSSNVNRIARIRGDLFAHWEVGDFTKKTFLLPIPNDSIRLPNRIATFTLTPLSPFTVPGGAPNATLTIVDDDKFPDDLYAISGNGVPGGPLLVTAALDALNHTQPLDNRTIDFYFSGQPIGSAVTNSQGVATLSTTTPAGIGVGSYLNLLTASFAGDTEYETRNGTGTATIIDSSARPLTILSAVSGIAPYQGTATLKSTLSANGAPLPGKSINFKLANVDAGNATTDANGVATLTNVPVAAGTAAGTYAQAVNSGFAGDGSYQPSSASGSLVVTKIDQTINFSQPSAKVFGGPPFSLTASASSNLPVSFEVVSGPAVVNGSTVTLTDIGSVTIRASQAGNANYNEATPVEKTFSVLAASGNLDPAFDPPLGANDFVWPVMPQPDGKIIIAGNFTTYDGMSRSRVARINGDGSLDASFNPGTGANALVLASIFQPDGKILIAGSFTTYNGISRPHIARLNMDGSLDTSFDPGTGATSSGSAFVFGIELQPDGKILIAGNFTGYNGTARDKVARLNPDGSLDSSFDTGTGSHLNAQAIVRQPDGRILVGGSAIVTGGILGPSLVRLNPNGSLDTSFAPTGINGSISTVVLQPDGRVLIGGQFSGGVRRLNSDGSADSSFNASASLVQVVLRQPDGKVLIGGSFTTVNGATRRAFARLNADGSLDSTMQLGNGFKNLSNTGQVFGLALLPHGQIVVGGFFDTFDGLPRNNLMQLRPSPGAISFSSPNYAVVESDPSANIVLNRTGGTDNQVVARINISDITTSPQDYALTQGALDPSFDPGQGPNGAVVSSALQPDGRLVIGGTFNTYKSASRGGVARVNPDGTLDNSFSPGAGANSSVWSTLLQPDGHVVIGGMFTTFNGSSRKRIARLNSDGSLDISFNVTGGGADQGIIYATASQVFDRIVIGGTFTSYDGAARRGIARLNSDGSLDSGFNPGNGVDNPAHNAVVQTIAVQPDHKTILGGDFTSFNGAARNRIARLNYDGSLDTSFDPGSGANNAIRGITLQPDGRMIIEGSFTDFNGTPCGHIARLNPDGSVDTSFNPGGVGSDATIITAILQYDGKIILGGGFTTFNGTPRLNFARLNVNGALDTSFDVGTGASGPVFTLGLQTDGHIFIGGGLSNYDGATRASIARVNGDFFVVWAPGDASDKTFTIPIVNDNLSEPEETLGLSIAETLGLATLGENPDAVLTILDFDPAASSLSSVSGSGVANDSLTLTATLISNGMNLSGKTVNFTVFGNSIGSATTDSNGVATLSTGAIPGLAAGNYPNVVVAAFPGDAQHTAVNANGPLTITAPDAPPLATFSGVSGSGTFNGVANLTAILNSGNTPLAGQTVTFTLLGSAAGVALTDQNGQATISGLSLPAGVGAGNLANAIGVSFAGTSSYTGCSATGPLTIAKASQTISFAPLPPHTVGDSFSLAATATSSLPVTFTVLSGPGSISGNTVSVNGPGAVTIRAAQAGDANYNPASPIDQSFNAARADQHITFDSLPSKTFGDPPFVLSANASSGLPVNFHVSGPATLAGNLLTITGAGLITVTASQAGNPNFNAAPAVDQSFNAAKQNQTINFSAISTQTIGDPAVTLTATSTSGLPVAFQVISGPASVSNDILTVTGTGNVTVRATQAGDNNFEAAPGVERSFLVKKATQVITFALPDRTFGDAPFGLSATASSNLPVSFELLSGPATISGNTLTISGAGNITVRATQTGDSNFEAAANVDRTFAVRKAAQAITFALADRNFGDAPFALSATASSNLPVSFELLSGPATISGNTLTISGAGNVTVRATQAGDNNFEAAANVDRTFVVRKAAQAITFALPDRTFGDAPFVLSAIASSNLVVSFELLSGPATINGNTLTINGSGNVTVRAMQAGDNNFESAANVDRSFTVRKAGQTITFALADRAFGDAPFALTANASSNLPVSFELLSGPASVNGNTVTLKGTGSVTVRATQAGDGNFEAAANVDRTFAVKASGQTITFAAPPDRTFGDAPFTLQASSSSSLPVAFELLSGPASINAGTVTINGAGIVSLRASQAGNADFAAAAPVDRFFTVNRATTAIALSSSGSPSNPGQSITFTATMTSQAGIPTGAIQFKVDGAALGSAVTLDQAGVARISTSTLTPGTHSIFASYDGDLNFSPSSATLGGGQTGNGGIEFSQTAYAVAERAGSISIGVKRTGDTSAAASIDYTTDDGSDPAVAVPCNIFAGKALERCDYTRATGTLTFAPGETEKSFVVLINDDSYVEGPETLALRLSSPSAGAIAGPQSTAVLSIEDDTTESPGNPLDDDEAFVRAHYHDFLNREPDAPGLQFWTNNIRACGADVQCREVKRIDTSAAFFLSIEFQDTGYFDYLLHQVSFGNLPGASVPIQLNQFLRDTQELHQGVAVGQTGWQQRLESNKQSFMIEFVSRAEFLSRYPAGTSAGQFVDALDTNAGGVLSDSLRADLIGKLASNPADAAVRAEVLRNVAEDQALRQRELNRAFVLMQYFGYLRRDPNAAPDGDFAGYNLWLDKLVNFHGSYRDAEMVRAFINSIEYRSRFGP